MSIYIFVDPHSYVYTFNFRPDPLTSGIAAGFFHSGSALVHKPEVDDNTLVPGVRRTVTSAMGETPPSQLSVQFTHTYILSHTNTHKDTYTHMHIATYPYACPHACTHTHIYRHARPGLMAELVELWSGVREIAGLNPVRVKPMTYNFV